MASESSETCSPPTKRPLIKQPESMDKGDYEDSAFPTSIEDFGYKFNEFGQLRDLQTNEPFKFEARPNDHAYNQKRYEALGDVITEYVYRLLISEGKLKQVFVPVDAKDNESQTFFFMSEDALTNKNKLLVLIHGSGAVKAGQWARRLIINDNLDKGTQMPYINRAISLGYGVIVLNTNDNFRILDGVKKFIRDNESAEKHATYVWENFVLKAAAKSISVIAHSYGGVITVNLMINFQKLVKEKVSGIALTDSVHSLRHQMVPPRLAQWLMKVSKNWVCSPEALDTTLSLGDNHDISRVSSGTLVHEMTSWSSFASVFEFLEEKYKEFVSAVG